MDQARANLPQRRMRTLAYDKAADAVEVANSDCFVFDVDLHRKGVPTAALGGFPAECLLAADKIGAACVSRLLSRPLVKAQ